MITLPKLAANALSTFLADDMKDRFGASHARLAEIIPFAAQLALECIGNSDALYHNVEHTMLVTLAGHDIFKGRALVTDSTPSDYSHFIVACLTHDIGYVRGIVKGRRRGRLRRSTRPGARSPCRAARPTRRSRPITSSGRNCSCGDRLSTIDELDGSRVAAVIEHTRFPYSSKPEDPDVSEEAGLLRAADLIGQLGDPHYLKKSNALYCEFDEVGLNRQLGYDLPADLIDKYPNFYWRKVSPYIQDAIRYLSLTSSGRQWINGLYANVFRAEHDLRQHGPQL